MERISTIQTASVITQPTDAAERPMTLIEKLEREYKKWCDCEDNSVFGGVEQLDARGRTRGLKDAIDIVKQHSDWVSVDEYLKIAKASDRVFVYDTFCEAVMPSLVRVINGRAGFQLTNGLYAMYVSHVCSMTVPKPPSEVQE